MLFLLRGLYLTDKVGPLTLIVLCSVWPTFERARRQQWHHCGTMC